MKTPKKQAVYAQQSVRLEASLLALIDEVVKEYQGQLLPVSRSAVITMLVKEALLARGKKVQS